MSCKSKKMSKTFAMALSTNTTTALDTKGCDCVLKALSGETLVYTSPDADTSQGYTLSESETLTFCGKLYLCGNDSKVCGMMYTTL